VNLNPFYKLLSYFSLFDRRFFAHGEPAFPMLLIHRGDDRNVSFEQTTDQGLNCVPKTSRG